MRLSEDRIDSLANQVAFHLVKKRLVTSSHSLRQVTAWVEKPMIAALTLEDEVDSEVTAYIEGLEKKPPAGSFAYQSLFVKKKEEVAARRGLKN